MDIRKIQLMKELEREYYGELRKKKEKGITKVQKEGIFVCIVLVVILVGLALL